MTARGKTYRRRLTDAEVREMRELHVHKRISGNKLGPMFGVTPATANRVLSRLTYANVPDIEGGTSECPCLAHTTARRQNVNLGRARAQAVHAYCVHCGTGVRETVGEVLAHSGTVLCQQCKGSQS